MTRYHITVSAYPDRHCLAPLFLDINHNSQTCSVKFCYSIAVALTRSPNVQHLDYVNEYTAEMQNLDKSRAVEDDHPPEKGRVSEVPD